MTWEKFAYICRRANGTIKPEESVDECINRVKQEPGSQLYGKTMTPDNISSMLLSKISTISDNAKAKKALSIYGDLNTLQNLSEPIQFKRITAYLAYVTLIFFITSAIYQFKVAPTFLESFESFDVAIPSHLTFYKNYWPYFVLIIYAILAVSILISYTLRSLFRFTKTDEKGFVFRVLIFKSIRESYFKIIDIVSFPVTSINDGDTSTNNTSTDNTSTESEIIKHLAEIQSANMDIAVEMKALIEAENKSLQVLCEKQMTLISTAVAIITISAIFFFLLSAYSPIFMLGETI